MAANLKSGVIISQKALEKSFFEDIQPIIADAHFRLMKCVLTGSGGDDDDGGQGATIPRGPLTVRLMLQLELVRRETRTPWKTLETFLPRVFDGDQLPGFSLGREIRSVMVEGAKVKALKTDNASYWDFLGTDWGSFVLTTRHVGSCLKGLGLSRQHLLKPETLVHLERQPSGLVNGVVIDLVAFYKKESLSSWRGREVLQFLGADLTHLNNNQLRMRLNKIQKTYAALNKSRRKNKEEMRLFLAACPVFARVTVTPAECPLMNPDSIKLRISGNRQASLRRELEELERTVAQERDKNAVLQDIVQGCYGDLQQLREQLAHCPHHLVSPGGEEQPRPRHRLQPASLKTGTATGAAGRYKTHQTLQRRERRLQQKEAVLLDHQKGRCQSVIRTLKRGVAVERQRVSNLKKTMDGLKKRAAERIAQLERAVRELRAAQPQHSDSLQREERVLRQSFLC